MNTSGTIGTIIWFIAFGYAVAQGIINVCTWYDDGLSKSQRLRIALRILDLEPSKIRLTTTFSRLVDQAFTKRHFSLSCVVRSTILSIAAALVVLGLQGLTDRDGLGIAIDIRSNGRLIDAIVINDAPSRWFFIFAINTVGNYFSLFETRSVIKYMARGASTTKIVILLAIDILLTIMIYTFMYLVGVMIIMKLNNVNMAVYDLIYAPLFAGQILNDFTEIVSLTSWISPMFISSFTTSIWLWMFGVSIFITKILSRSGAIVEYLKEALDIENRPIYSVGLVMVAVWAALYGGIVISFLGHHLLSE